ncbi:hypothetical protein BJ741DRAFT_622189 [Chytriomyces cf. hyalinus JEL632]|nr:hypothetical protein BJ741DRAFT_622189 [Chytriomyces cf. hyalinus JEL632]
MQQPMHQHRSPQTPPPPPPPPTPNAAHPHPMTRKGLPMPPQSQQTDQCALDVLTDPTKFYASIISLSITSDYNDTAAATAADSIPESTTTTPPQQQQWQNPAMRRSASQSAPSKSHHHRAASESVLLLKTRKLQQSPLAATAKANGAVETSPIEPSINFRNQKPNNFVSAIAAATPGVPSASKLHASSRGGGAPGPPPSVSRSKSVLTSLRSMWQTGVNSAR